MSDARESDKQIAKIIYEADWARREAEERLLDLLFGEKHEGANFCDFTFDDYDGSVEFKQASPGFLLTPENLLTLWASGFSRTWVCYTDGSERYYYEGGSSEGGYKGPCPAAPSAQRETGEG